MTTNERAKRSLIVGTVAGLVTMAFHPTGVHTVNEVTGPFIWRNVLVHGLAISALPLVIVGLLALTLRFTADRDLAVCAFAFFALGAIALMSAATASGFIASNLMASLVEKPEARDALVQAIGYTSVINRSYAKVGAGLETAGLGIWSWTMLRTSVFPRGLAIYGLIYGAIVLALLMSGNLPLDAHGFGVVVLGQAVWLIWAGMRLAP